MLHLRLLDAHAHVHARQQPAARVGQLGAQADLAGGGVDAEVGEQQASALAERLAVVQKHLHLGRLGAAGARQPPGGQRLAQLQHLVGRLRDVDVERIDLLHHGQRGAAVLLLVDQRALGHQRAADAAGDRRRHRGIPQVDAGRAHRRLAGGHLRLGRFFGGHGGVVLLLAHGVGGHQRLVARGRGTGLRQLGLRLRQLGLGTLQHCFIGRGVDAEQGLPGLDVAALGEHALLQDAGDARAHLGHARGLQPSGQLGGQVDGAGLHRQHRHFRRRHAAAGAGRCAGARLLVATGGQRQQGNEAQRRQTARQRGGGGLVFGHEACSLRRGIGRPCRRRQAAAIAAGRSRGTLRQGAAQAGVRDSRQWRELYIHT